MSKVLIILINFFSFLISYCNDGAKADVDEADDPELDRQMWNLL